MREKRGSGGTNSLKADELVSLQAAWRAFVIAHAQEIRDGKQWALGDPALTPELFGRALHFRLADGIQWPPRK